LEATLIEREKNEWFVDGGAGGNFDAGDGEPWAGACGVHCDWHGRCRKNVSKKNKNRNFKANSKLFFFFLLKFCCATME
jgi:hypothetical protein